MEAGDQDFSYTSAGGMNKVIVFDQKSYMRIPAAIGIKKNQIAGAKIVFSNFW